MKMTLKIIGVVLLIILLAATVFFFYARYRLNHVKDGKNLQGSVDKAAGKFVQSGKTYGLVVGIYKNGTTYIKGYGTLNKDNALLPDSSIYYGAGVYQ